MAINQPAPHSAVPPTGNGFAVAGMVLGIIGIVFCWFPFAGWLCAALGIILGALGISKANRLGGKRKGMAVAGLVCGILGLMIGILLFALATMAVNSLDDYRRKSKKTEAALQLRSIETKVKTFRDETSRLPNSASAMPTTAVACMYQKQPQSAWHAAGWGEMSFHVDEDSRYQYSWTVTGEGNAQTGVATAVGDLNCDGTFTTQTMTITIVQGNALATYTDPTPD